MDLTVVHIGAGIHSISKHDAYKKLIKSALVKSKNSIIEASQKLEKSPLTNTGYGSSLNIRGEVSCDATIIEVTPEFRNEVSLHNLKSLYPITETLKLLNKLNILYGKDTTFEKLGITRPISLDANQISAIDEVLTAHKLPQGEEIEAVSVESLVLPRAQSIYDYYIKNSNILEADDLVQDTIGLLQIKDLTTTMVTSSGGNFFKLPGRIGCAGALGCAIETVSNDSKRITCMCSGNGEQILKLTLARTLCYRAIEYDGEELAQDLITLVKLGQDDLYIGVIMTIEDKEEGNRLIYFHSTESFYFGFLNNQHIEVVLSRLQTNQGKFIHGEYKV